MTDFEAGFTYTQSTDRLWRKNRQTTSGNSCLGTDINRNWNYQWSTPGGSSTDPCAQDYRGSAPSSAPENKGLTAFVNNLAQSTTGLKLYIDYHSYSQLFMTRKLHPGETRVEIKLTSMLVSLWLLLHSRLIQQCRVSVPRPRGSGSNQRRLRYCLQGRTYLPDHLPSVRKQR